MQESPSQAQGMVAQQGVPSGGVSEFPDAPAPGTLGALKAYLLKPAVIERMQHLCNSSEEEARRMLGGLQELLETSDDPSNLLSCSPRSLVNCAVVAHRVNLPIDARKFAYVVPYFNKARKERVAVLMPSYMGFEYVIRKHYPDFESRTEFVFPDDHFKVMRAGGDETYEHVPANPFNSDYSKANGLFYYFTYTDGSGEKRSQVHVLPMSEIVKSKEAAESSKFWGKWFRQMAVKTIVRSACGLRFKTLVHDLIAADNAAEQEFEAESETASVFKESPLQKIIERQRELSRQQTSAAIANLQKKTDTGVDKAADENQVVVIESVPESEAGNAENEENIPSHIIEAASYEVLPPQSAQEEPLVHQEADVVENVEIAVPEQDMGVANAADDSWDGKSLSLADGRTMERNWSSANAAAAYLINMLAMCNFASRWEIVKNNARFMEVLKSEYPQSHVTILGMLEEGEDG